MQNLRKCKIWDYPLSLFSMLQILLILFVGGIYFSENSKQPTLVKLILATYFIYNFIYAIIVISFEFNLRTDKKVQQEPILFDIGDDERIESSIINPEE